MVSVSVYVCIILIILTQWPLGEELTVNASTDDFRCEPVRTLDDGDALERLIDVDIKHECTYSYDTRHSLLYTMLHARDDCRH